MMARLNRIKIGLGAAKTAVCLVTLLTAMPAFARTFSPTMTSRTACLGGKITGDERIDGCTALIAAKGTRRKDLIGAYLNRGADYLSKNNNDVAIANFSELIRLDPKYFGAYTNRGEAYRRKGLLDQAIADLDRAIALNRKDSFAWFNRGITYSDKGDPDHAIADYNQAIKLNSRDSWYFNNRGNSYSDKKDFGSA